MIKNKNILIFGENSFIASYLVNRIKKNNKLIFFRQKYVKIDTNDFYRKKINSLISTNELDYIINFHAHTDIKYSNTDTKYDFYHNCSIIHSIIESMIDKKSKAFFLNFGTVTQVGYTDIQKPINYLYRGKPETVFDLHKQYNEDFISIKKKFYNLNATTLRLSNIYGVGNTHSINRGIINKMIDKSINENYLNLYGDGKFVRDFLYIEDVIDAILLTMKNYKKITKDYYYVCNGKGHSFNHLAKYISLITKKYLKKNIQIKYLKWPSDIDKIEKRSFVGNSNEFKKITGWKPKYSLSKGIEQIIKKKLSIK